MAFKIGFDIEIGGTDDGSVHMGPGGSADDDVRQADAHRGDGRDGDAVGVHLGTFVFGNR